MGTVTNLDFYRARKRINEFDDTIDRFVRIATEANGSACAMETSKLSYLESLPPDIRTDLGY